MGEQIAPIVNQWRLIETAPKQRKIIVHYLNEAGRHRTVMACYYGEKSLEMHDDYDDVGTWDEESGTLFADAGWYEEHDSDNPILPLGGVPTHWMPLPEPPATTNPTPEHQLSAAHEIELANIVYERGAHTLMEMMKAYERRVRSDCKTQAELDARPWECAEYRAAADYLRKTWPRAADPTPAPQPKAARFYGFRSEKLAEERAFHADMVFTDREQAEKVNTAPTTEVQK